MFPKNKISVAVAVAAGGLAIAGTQVTQAASAFFPQIVKGASVTTIVSVISTSDWLQTYDGDLHYRIYYKTTDDNAAECIESNRYLPTSPMDVNSMDIAGNLGTSATRGLLFNDPTAARMDAFAEPASQTYALLKGVAAARAYMVVDDMESASGAHTVGGEAFLFDFGGGAAWSYQAFANDGDDLGTEKAEGTEFDFSWTRMRNPSPVNLLPLYAFNSGFLVTPVNIPAGPEATANDWATENMVPTNKNSMAAVIDFQIEDWYGETAAIFDRDENPLSGSTAKKIVCIGKVAATDIINLQGSGEEDGGWGGLVTKRVDVKSASDPSNRLAASQPSYFVGSAPGTTGAVVYKVEYNLPGAAINGYTFPGVFNTGALVLPELNSNLAPKN